MTPPFTDHPVIYGNKATRLITIFGLLVLLGLFAMFPFYWMIKTSLEPSRFIYPPQILPWPAKLDTYIRIFQETDLARWIRNAFLVGIGTTGISLFLSVFAAYSLAKLQFWGRGFITYLLIVTQMIPGVLLVVPIYIIFGEIRLLNTLVGLTLAYVSFSLPVSAWFLSAFIEAIPRVIDEAAVIDGASHFQRLKDIIIPVALPGIIATAMFSFMLAWDEYLFAITLINSPENWVPSTGLGSFIGEYTTDWNIVMASATVVTVPAVALFMYLQRFLLAGLTAGAVKG